MIKFYKLLFIFCISKHMSCTLFLQQTFKNMKLEVYSHVTFLECTTTKCQKIVYFYVWKKKIEKSCMADGLLIEYYTADGSNKKMKSYLKANGTINFIGQQSFSFCKTKNFVGQ